MKQLKIIRIVLVSPGDVAEERKVMEAVIDELNHGVADDRKLRLELSRWETDAYPEFLADGPQRLLDPILRIEDCDILLGIFWKRFGTPTKDAQSGTEHEIRTAIKSWEQRKRPQIMIYFKEAPVFPKTPEESEQLELVMRFRKEFPKEGLFWKFKEVSEFERLARQHLVNFIRSQYPLENRMKGNEERKQGAVEGTKSTEEKAPEVLESSETRNHWLLKMNPQTWEIEQLSAGNNTFFNTHYYGEKRPEYRLFDKIKKGDYVLGFASGNYQRASA